MFVQPSFRGQRIGTVLATRFIEWARENKARSIKVTAYYANEKAVNFYRRLGFRPKQITLTQELKRES
jgi:GNAT superfamily N-acetyltransferase